MDQQPSPSILERVRGSDLSLPVGALVVAVGLWAASAQRAGWLALNDQEPLLLGLPAGGARQVEASPARDVRCLVLVIADGLRVDVARELPAIAALARQGLWAEAEAAGPTFSAASYTSWLTGLDPVDSGVRTNRYPTAVSLDSVPQRARADGLRVVAYEDGKPTPLRRLFGAHVRFLGGSWSAALDALPRADLAIVVLGEVDVAGHRHGASAPAYLQAAQALDRRLHSLATRLDPDRDLLVVVNDHGHLPGGGHGGLEPGVRELFVVARGRGVVSDGQRGRISQRDLAPTVAALLGLRPPAHNRGWPIDWGFDPQLEPGFLSAVFANHLLARARVELHLVRQLELDLPAGYGTPRAAELMRAGVGNLAEARRLGRHVVDQIAASVARARQAELNRVRSWRAGVFGVGWLVLLGVLLAVRRQGIVRIDWVGWLLPLLTALGVSYGSLWLFGLRPSLSINGPWWPALFVAAAAHGAAWHLLLLHAVGGRDVAGRRAGAPGARLNQSPHDDPVASRVRLTVGRVLAGCALLGGLALAGTVSAPLESATLLPDLRLVASMFLLRAWFVAFALLAGAQLVLAGLCRRARSSGAVA